jgi:hypothetical protein
MKDGQMGHSYPTVTGYNQVIDTATGKALDGLYYKEIEINTLYDIWSEILGGENSVTKEKNTFKYSEDSNEGLAKIMNNLVIKKSDAKSNIYD